jgi:hypothetical protein
MTKLEMVENFQCPGCVCGSDTKCGNFRTEPLTPNDGACQNHVAGTYVMSKGKLCLGLPTGFNQVGILPKELKSNIRLFESFDPTLYNHLNVPVWAMEKDGFLFVRCFCPRKNYSFVDVINGGKLSDVPNAIDVGKFVDQID